VGPDVRVLRKRVEALAHDHERRRVVDFVENNLQDLICSGLGASGWCGATAATHRQDGPFALAGPSMGVFVARVWSDGGEGDGIREQGLLNGKGNRPRVTAVLIGRSSGAPHATCKTLTEVNLSIVV
jgi:hypothetical protein